MCWCRGDPWGRAGVIPCAGGGFAQKGGGDAGELTRKNSTADDTTLWAFRFVLGLSDCESRGSGMSRLPMMWKLVVLAAMGVGMGSGCGAGRGAGEPGGGLGSAAAGGAGRAEAAPRPGR